MQYFHDFMLVCRDGFKSITETIASQLLNERFKRLHEHCSKQLVWLVRQLVRSSVAIGAEGLIFNLLRQVVGGDVSVRNVWLADQLCDMFKENRLLVYNSPYLLPPVTYSLLRLIEDHLSPQFSLIRQKEVTLVVSILRDKFSDLLLLGRDLVRLLQNIAKVPEIELLWRDILLNPSSLSPNFTGGFFIIPLNG